MSTFFIDVLRRICKLFMFTKITTPNDMERIKNFLIQRPESLSILVALGLLGIGCIVMLILTYLQSQAH